MVTSQRRCQCAAEVTGAFTGWQFIELRFFFYKKKKILLQVDAPFHVDTAFRAKLSEEISGQC